MARKGLDIVTSFRNEVEMQIGYFLQLWAIGVQPVRLKLVS